MVGIFKYIALSLATSMVALGASAEKRALVPALLGNLDLAVSACPDIAIGGGGGAACGEQRDSSSTSAPQAPAPQSSVPPYNNAQPPATKPAPSAPAPAPSTPAPAPAPSSPAPAPPAPSSSCKN
ncbi:hypothetical protein BX667DRAFT_506057 [Coemansia mojavensis]|nr:hypothetical protein BX667DRAFT_506057 [Coemansia mojavensis]